MKIKFILRETTVERPVINSSLLPRSLQGISLRVIKLEEAISQEDYPGTLSHLQNFVVEPFLHLRLRHLCLDNVAISSELINKQLSLLGKQLSTLKLQDCFFAHSAAHDFNTLTTNLINLEQIDIVKNYTVRCDFQRSYSACLQLVLNSIALYLTKLTSCGLHFNLPQINIDTFLRSVSPSGSLTRIYLSGTEITSEVFDEFADRNKHIEALHLFSCTIKDEILLPIANKLQHLKDLQLNGLENVSEDGFKQLAYHTSLQRLEIVDTGIAINSIHFVVRSLPCLTHLILSPRDYKTCFKALRKQNPYLTVSRTPPSLQRRMHWEE